MAIPAAKEKADKESHKHTEKDNTETGSLGKSVSAVSTVSTPWLDVTDALCSNFIRCQDKHSIQQRVTLYHFLVFLARGLWKWFAIFKTNLSCFCSTLWMEKVKDSLWYLGWMTWVKKMLPLFHLQFIEAGFKSSFTHRMERDKQSHQVNKKGKNKSLPSLLRQIPTRATSIKKDSVWLTS